MRSTSGFGELLEELPRVCAERLDVPALALGVDRVERERGLARTARSSEHDQLPARERDAHVLQVVLPGADDDQAIHGSLVVTTRAVRFEAPPAVSTAK